MSTLSRCNSCHGEYSEKDGNGAPYFHTCPPEIIEHARFDGDGNLLAPEIRHPRVNIRDERPDLSAPAGKYKPLHEGSGRKKLHA